jgi:protein TonB
MIEDELFGSDAPPAFEFTEREHGDADFELSSTSSTSLVPRTQRTGYLKFGLTLSLVLHLLVIFALPKIGPSDTKSALRPGESVTPIRLVELPPPKKEEPPPEKASAISDRNHIAERERLPKAVPGPRGPIGRPAPMERLAALSPPQAPEDLVKPEEEAPKEKTVSPDVKSQPIPKTKSAEAPKKPKQAPREKPSRNKGVDLRPTPAEVARALSSPGLEKSGGEFDPDGDVEEAVVDINTREDRFFSYLLHLKQKIEGVWVYPKAAAGSGLGGELILEFVVMNNGALADVSLLEPSGHGILDDSAMSAIRTAAPYHPFPPSLKAKRLRIRARFIYVTQSFFRRIM